MATDRCAKWSKESRAFFESAAENSLVLDLVISHGCLTQTGEGFEELVNSINAIRNKIKKVNITDTSYLYRHDIPEFAKYSDSSIPTEWYLKNKESIEKLVVDTELKSWVPGIQTDEFKRWNKQIKIDFAGDENGNGIVQQFRDNVMQESAIAAYKGKKDLKNCLNFILEECSYVCANLRKVLLVYPTLPPKSVMDCVSRYNVNLVPISYQISKQAQRSSKCCDYLKSEEVLDREIATFMKKKVSNVNFFVIDKYGNHIYKNYAYSKIPGNINARMFHRQAWEVDTMVMRTKKEVMVEEVYKDTCFLSVKAPLFIDNNVEGIIGLSVDITDRKKLESLAEQVAHDIRSPLVALSMFTRGCKNLSEREHILLNNISESIQNIANGLLDKYKANRDTNAKVGKAIDQDRTVERYISVYWSLHDVITNKRYQYKESKVTFSYTPNPEYKFVFMKGDFSDFCCMMSNLINNSVEAMEGKEGIIDTSFTVKDHKVSISIKDKGKGMPKEMVDKIMSNVQVGTKKKGGHGIGMQQIESTLQAMNAQMLIKSIENVGTEFTLIFPESQPPKWFADKIVLHKGDTVVVLDDDASIHDVWKNRFEAYSKDINVKYFIQGSEAVDFINSVKEKNKVFLLTDYELRNQNINGVDVIEKSNMQKQSILVTSLYISRIKDFNEKSNFIKTFSKTYIDDIPILMDGNTARIKKTCNTDIVFVDDDKNYLFVLDAISKERGLSADTYANPDDFLNNSSKYSKNTKIVVDHDMKHKMNGFDLAHKLHESGYTRLWMMTGTIFEKHKVPPYLKVVAKDVEEIEILLKA